MKILSRYVFREFCVPLFYCITGFLSIYLLFELFGSFSRLMEARPGVGKAFTYFAGYLAPYLEWMAPACLMLATLYTMWSFCRHSELIAMRASGIGFFAIVKPLLVVSVLMADCGQHGGKYFFSHGHGPTSCLVLSSLLHNARLFNHNPAVRIKMIVKSLHIDLPFSSIYDMI